MNGSEIETVIRQGGYCWCFFSLLSSGWRPLGLPQGSSTTLLLSALSSGCFIFGSHGPSPDVDVRRRRRMVAAAAAGYGLVLYGATRFLFRRWNPAAVVGVAFGIGQVWSLGISIMSKLMGGLPHLRGVLYNVHGPFLYACQTVGRINNRAISVPLLYALIGAYIPFASAIAVIASLSITYVEVPPTVDVWTRDWRRRFRTWALPFFHRPGPLYKHQPFVDWTRQTPKIRLLKLQRRVPFGRIRCELITVDLHDDLEYDAISYHWGDAPFTADIYIDGRVFKVAPVVEDLLHHLSSYRRDRFIWIDAICINQLDDAEKDLQIPLMRDIYRGAASVIVWLNDVQDPWKARCMLSGIWHEYHYGTTESCLQMLQMYSEQYAESGWAQLMNLFAHPWFSRVWVMQEIVQARTAVLLASGQPLQFDHIATFAQMMTSQTYAMALMRSAQPGIHDEAIHGLGIAALMAALSESRDDPQAGLATLLGIFGDLRATKAVDRIYGLLGLLSAEEAAQPHLRPDSSKKVEEVYTAVARHLIPTAPSDTLSLAGIGYSRKIDGIPSWVPDWTSVGKRDTQRQHFATIQRAARFAGSLGMTLRPAIMDDRRHGPVMITWGYVLDEIQHIGPEMGYTAHNFGKGGTDEEITAALRSHLRSRRLVQQHARQPYPTGQPLDEVFWRSLIADTQFERPAPAKLGVGCRVWERILHNFAQLEPGEWDGSNDASSMDEALPAIKAIESTRLALEWNSARIMAATGRAAAVTKEGYVSMVPPKTQVGDWVCVVFGMETPFVMRPVAVDQSAGAGDAQNGGEEEDADGPDGGKHFVKLVGETYVHGMMDGQALLKFKKCDVFNVL